ncbi:MAG: isoprenylcysteine carboxylmethyltransferase family protein [Christensenellaceae bacterium]|nr:isoprenylcysteine carboxylmethyltransferase family protein [Christensenellaceae bacterium]
MLMRRGIQVFVIAKGKRLPERLLEALLMPLLILWSLLVALTALGKPIFPAPMFWNSPALAWVGSALCGLGLILFAAALSSFGNAWRVGIDDEHSDALVTNGVFAHSRNPIFLFMHLFFFGVFLMFPNWFFLAAFLIEAIGIHRQILNEERFLHKKYGDAYDAYRKKVRRYL